LAKLVRVASITFRGTANRRPVRETVGDNLTAIVDLLEKAARDEPDIACLPECSPTRGLSCEDSVKMAEEVPGPMFERVSSVAKEHGMYVVFPMLEKRNSRVYNSALLIDDKGDLIGRYHKVYPTIPEIEAGISPGDEQKPLKTGIAALGFAICFDINFEDAVRSQFGQGVKLAFFPSAYPGGLQLRQWAFKYGVYVVSACSGEESVMIDPLGRVMCRSSTYSPILCRTLNLDYEVLHLNFNYEKLGRVKDKYGPRVELEVSRPEAVLMLSSNAKDITAGDVIKEFKLETREEYFKRASEVRRGALPST